jgi:ADP-ribosylglycohydrolase
MTRRLTALYASLAADALGLGPHWIYNQTKVARLYPEGLSSFDDPHSQYHPNRTAGQFTHYGDQALTLLRSLAFRRGWSESSWREDWRAMWQHYDGYLDSATTETLANHDAGEIAPSPSNDLAGASRIAPLLVALADSSLEEKIAAARAQTALTHGDPIVIDSAE